MKPNINPIFLTAAPVAAVLASGSLCAQTPQRPNIIYILADDLGYGDLSCYELIRFTQYYASCPVSAPSLAVLMSR